MVCGYCEGDSEEVKKVDGVAIVLKDYEERHGTDRLYILILVAVWVAITILGAVGAKDGNIDMLLRPYNTQGQTCGIGDLEKEENFVFIQATPFPYGNCVENCPSETAPAGLPILKTNYECVPEIAALATSDFETYLLSMCCQGGVCTDDINTGTYQFANSATCLCALKTESDAWFNRCVDKLSAIEDGNPNTSDYMKMFMADLITARAVVFGFGFVIALLFAFLYTYLMSMNCMASIIVWGCISGVLMVGVAIVSYGGELHAQWKAEVPQIHTPSQIGWLEGFNYGFMVLCFIWFLLMIYMCKSINMAIKCVCMGAKALDEMPLMVFVPIIQITGFILFLIPWLYYCVFIASVGELQMSEPTPIDSGPITVDFTYGTWKTDNNDRVGAKLAFMFFALLWTMNFIANLGSLVIGHAVSVWYFTKPEDRAEKINNSQIFSSYKLVFRYHLGTVAFGSFLIAVIQYARAVALYIERKSKKECRDKTWMKVVCCAMHLCLCLLETCMKFISKNAYIQCAIYGTDFCTSAKNGFALVLNNMKRIGAITITSGLCLIIGKFFVTILATGASYIFLSQQYEQSLYSVTGPTLIVAIIAWMTATMFMDVLAMAIDTIFICFISDETSNNGTAAFAGDDMKEFVDTHGKMDEEKSGGCCGDDGEGEGEASTELANKQ